MSSVHRKNMRRSGDRSVGHAKPVNVYVRVHDVIRDIHHLGDLLTRKVNTPGVVLIPTETCVQHNDNFTFCTMSCDSVSYAKKLRELLLRNGGFTPRIDCSFRDYRQTEDARRLQANRAKLELRQTVERELDTMSEQALRSHDQKLTELQEKITQASSHLTENVHVSRKALEEIAALEHKQIELQRQRKEFSSAVERFCIKLDAILRKDCGYEDEVRALRKQVGIECCRLEKALPMYARRQEIVELIKQHRVSILLAETGSGKSTQVVQYLLDDGLANTGKIVCTQPRKVAAISLATHVAHELVSNVGKIVGYKVGMRNKTSDVTKVVYMTDHALLNECLADPDLKAFSCVVIDEAHERSLFTDLLLIMVKRCMKKRPDLRVIITSATIDPQVFVDYFAGDCPVMKVSGRAFPVDVIWDNNADEEKDFENYVEAAVEKAIHIHLYEPPGDILVFLTSAQEIQKCCDLFQERLRDRPGPENYKVLPLHGQLQANEQQKVFEPLENNKRKIVFATNCAETSITIDGIKYVVDTGVAKEMRYDAKRNLRCLEVTVISCSSAEQRKGRAGRTAPGKCYRLYSQSSYQAMEAISKPEILKTHLGHALLKLSEFGITPDMYDFVQSPSPIAIKDALTTLRRLGALEGDVITDAGKWIARLPFDPKLGLMTLKGRDCSFLYDSIVLAALVSAGSGLFYRGNTEEEHKNLDKAKLKFSQSGGDSMTALVVYQAWVAVDERQKTKWCMENSVNCKAIRAVRETVKEVIRILKNETELEVAYNFSLDPATADRLRKIYFACNTCNLCHYLGKPKAGYFAALASRQVHFHPSSAICSLASFPQWVAYDQLLKTSRDFITGITVVDDDWVKEITADQCGFDVEQVRKMNLLKVFSQEAGIHAFYAMVGLRYTRLKEMETKAQDLDPSAVIVVEGNKKLGDVRVYTTGQVYSICNIIQELQQAVATAQIETKLDVWEVPVGPEKSGLRVVLGLGGSVTDILMPHETRKVYISKPTADITEDGIKLKFCVYGEVTYCRQFLQESEQWGFLIFRKAEEAVAAVQGTKDDENNIATPETRRAVYHNSDFRAKLSWNRRQGRGIAYVEVSPAYLASCMRLDICIGDTPARISLDKKNESSLFLRNLPGDVTEDAIKHSILHELRSGENAEGIVKKVVVPRVHVPLPTTVELERLAEEIRKKIAKYLISSTVRITVLMPKTEKTASFAGIALFSDPMEGFQACKQVKRRGLNMNSGEAVSIEPVLSVLLRVSKPVYDAYREELDKLISGQLKDMNIEVKVDMVPKGSIVKLTIQANDTNDLVKARTFLSELLHGDILECAHVPDLKHFLTTAGRKILENIAEKSKAYISVDNRLRTLAIHGTIAVRTVAKMMINEHLREIEGSKVEEVNLKEGSRPPGLLKAILAQYGEELEKLQQETGLRGIDIDLRRHKLQLKGPQESINKAKEGVKKVDATLRAALSLDAAQDEDSVDCSACFCPIEQGDLYRLEACAHPYCKDCILRQVTIAIREHKIPVLCSHEGCDVPLAWKDFNSLVRQGHIQLAMLANAAVSSYIMANRDKASFCPTPNCPLIFRLTSETEAQVFKCPECGVHTCTGCKKQAHDGITCSMLRSERQEGQGLAAWIREDPQNRKACPGCSSPIQKDGGCNKMHCTACHSIFCWICSKRFSTEGDCYRHLESPH